MPCHALAYTLSGCNTFGCESVTIATELFFARSVFKLGARKP